MNARLLGEFHRFTGTINIGIDRTSETGNGCAFDALGNFCHRFEIAIRGNRKTGFDDVDAHRIQEIGDFKLLFERHGCARRLFAIAQGGVENDDAVFIGCGGHNLWSFVLPGTRLS